MTRVGLLALIVLACLFAGGCPLVPGPDGDECPVVGTDSLAQADLGFWWENAVNLRQGETVKSIWQLDEMFYVLTSRNALFAFNAEIGNLAWSHQFQDEYRKVLDPCHASDVLLPPNPRPGLALNPPDPRMVNRYNVVILNTTTYALVLDRATGQLLHKFGFPGVAATSGGACDGELFYVGSSEGNLQAYDLQTGMSVWRHSSGEMITASPVIFAKTVYFASRSGRILAVRQGSLYSLVWDKTFGSGFVGDITVNTNGMFAGSLDYSVYSVVPLSGDEVWLARCGGPIRQAVQVGERNVYALAEGEVFRAMGLVDGRDKWTLSNGAFVAAEIGGKVQVISRDNELLVVDGALGQVRTTVAMTGLDMIIPSTSTESIYAASRGGLICCIRAKSAGFVTPDMLKGQ